MCAECSCSLGSEISDPLKLKLQAVVSYQMYGFIPIAVIKCPETKQLVRGERKLFQLLSTILGKSRQELQSAASHSPEHEMNAYMLICFLVCTQLNFSTLI